MKLTIDKRRRQKALAELNRMAGGDQGFLVNAIAPGIFGKIGQDEYNKYANLAGMAERKRQIEVERAFEASQFKQSHALRQQEVTQQGALGRDRIQTGYNTDVQNIQFQNQMNMRSRDYQYGQTMEQNQYDQNQMNRALPLQIAGVGVAGVSGYANMMRDLETAKRLRKYGE